MGSHQCTPHASFLKGTKSRFRGRPGVALGAFLPHRPAEYFGAHGAKTIDITRRGWESPPVFTAPFMCVIVYIVCAITNRSEHSAQPNFAHNWVLSNFRPGMSSPNFDSPERRLPILTPTILDWRIIVACNCTDSRIEIGCTCLDIVIFIAGFQYEADN